MLCRRFAPKSFFLCRSKEAHFSALQIRFKERTSLCPKMFDLLTHKRFANAKISGKATDAKKIGGSSIDHTLVNGYLIRGKVCAALTALTHFCANLQRKTLQECGSIVG